MLIFSCDLTRVVFRLPSFASFQVVASAIVDKYIGESARVVREMFGYAKVRGLSLPGLRCVDIGTSSPRPEECMYAVCAPPGMFMALLYLVVSQSTGSVRQ